MPHRHDLVLVDADRMQPAWRIQIARALHPRDDGPVVHIVIEAGAESLSFTANAVEVARLRDALSAVLAAQVASSGRKTQVKLHARSKRR